MDVGRAFSDAWRTTFREKAQWPFVAVIAVVFAVLTVGLFVSMAVLLATALGTAGIEVLSPTSEYSTYNMEIVGRVAAGTALGILGVGFVWSLVMSYLRALLESGLAYSAGAIGRGHRPSSAEIWREAFGFSGRVWGAQILSVYLPMAAATFIGYGLLFALGLAGIMRSGETSSVDPAIAASLCFGIVFFALFMFVSWAFTESWSQLSVRHIVLWRQGVTAGLGQGFRVWRARFGYVLLVMVALLGVNIVLFGVYSVGDAILKNGMPTNGAYACTSFLTGVLFYAAALVISVFFSNLWTAIVLQARPEAGGPVDVQQAGPFQQPQTYPIAQPAPYPGDAFAPPAPSPAPPSSPPSAAPPAAPPAPFAPPPPAPPTPPDEAGS